MKFVNPLAAGMLLFGHALCGAAIAAPVTLSGNTVDFSFDDALLGLYGQAYLSGDALYFTPVDFQARSLNGEGYALANGTLNIKVTARDGWSFSGMQLVERGDYLLLGTGSTAGVTGLMRVFDEATPLFDLSAGIAASSPLDLPGMPTRNWQAGATLDLSGWGTVRTVNVTVRNQLLASTAEPASLAQVEKSFVGLAPFMAAVTPVPEAQTYAMMLAGLGLVGTMAWRRRAISE